MDGRRVVVAIQPLHTSLADFSSICDLKPLLLCAYKITDIDVGCTQRFLPKKKIDKKHFEAQKTRMGYLEPIKRSLKFAVCRYTARP